MTNDLARIDVLSASGAAGDLDGNGRVDIADFSRFTTCFTGAGGGVPPGCGAADFDGDGDVDCDDWRMFKAVWTSPEPPDQIPYCDVVGGPGSAEDAEVTALLLPSPNPTSTGMRIAYALASRGPVRLDIHDLRGRIVARLVAGEQPGGRYEVFWDGRDGRGDPMPSGVYFCRLAAGGKILIRRLTLVK